MAHFAEIDENNVVLRVIVGVDEPLDGEAIYHEMTGTTWKKTSYNTVAGEHLLGGTPFRKNYAGIGYTYDSDRDAFIPPQPFPSWTLDEQTCQWNSPAPFPNDEKQYFWDEPSVSWKEFV
ncbi:hypothetical protein UFOVP566_15 [uncultured Caudovirales phage]|uniref:Uncharacterized protein n=1 Tax=uncultured Caudovirales phage TaxID=2100421 RepID=A0A6J5MWE0_9CAUD|nr:hypothetical protein UFOVP294_70 [uncultured Caudovirales phage]CAB4150281.1 hypothetical protein UFOVP566_15 [uncultured Caudovirales phage]